MIFEVPPDKIIVLLDDVVDDAEAGFEIIADAETVAVPLVPPPKPELRPDNGLKSAPTIVVPPPVRALLTEGNNGFGGILIACLCC